MRLFCVIGLVLVAGGPAAAQPVSPTTVEQELGIAGTDQTVFWQDYDATSAALGSVVTRRDTLSLRYTTVRLQMTAADRATVDAYFAMASQEIADGDATLEGPGTDSAQWYGSLGDSYLGEQGDSYDAGQNTAWGRYDDAYYDDAYTECGEAEAAYATGGDRLARVRTYVDDANFDLDGAERLIASYGG